MFRQIARWSLVGLSLFVGAVGRGEAQDAKPCKVLVVMSYEETFPWDTEIKEGVEQVLGKQCGVTYFYMNTKSNPAGGAQKAKEAYDLYLELQPDGVIASDDNAQAMFVVPYLKEKVATPVMFCGVNSAPEIYGYPTANVSGILERINIKESLIFLRQLVPSIKTVSYLAKESETGQADIRQFEAQTDLPATFIASKLPTTMPEALAAAASLNGQVDALFLESFEGIPDENGAPLSDPFVIAQVSAAFGKPTISTFGDNVTYGVLCAVVRTGQEQGSTAAEMLLKAINGTPVSELALTKNQYGRRIINIEVMQRLGIKANPKVIRGAELVKTAK